MVAPTDEHLYTAKEIERGYAVDMKRVVLAYGVETIIVITSMIGAWLFAVQYGHNDFNTMLMMMLGPIAYAVVEFCRVPLALAVRRPPAFNFHKFVIVLGLIGAAFVTVKSVSQLGQIMFQPRLMDVVHAGESLAEAESAVTLIETQIADADKLVAQRTSERESADQEVTEATANLAKNPGQVCKEISGTGKNGRPYKSMRCVTDPNVAALKGAVNTATTHRDAAMTRLNEATTQRNAIDRAGTEATLRGEKTKYREAVLNSQLHSFTAMLFGKKPTEVSDDEIARFLRLFVFIPAIGAAFSATIIGLTAVTRIPPPPPTQVELADADEYILGPLAERILRQATEEHLRAMNDSMPKPPPSTEQPPPEPPKPNGAARWIR